MGLEATCKLRLGRYAFTGKAHVDSAAFTFRGETRVDIALKDVRDATVGGDGALSVTHAGGEFTLELEHSDAAAKWARKLLHPPTLADKLGLKPGQRVAVLGVKDPDFLAEATARLGTSPDRKPAEAMDIIFHAADSAAELARLKQLKAHLQPAGAIWVVSRKGREATVKDTDVFKAARAAGLIDNKVCSFSTTHTALRLVIPRDRR
jgi:hypothetical protein